MGPTPFYGARAEKNPFAIKQTNICRLSGDIINTNSSTVVISDSATLHNDGKARSYEVNELNI